MVDVELASLLGHLGEGETWAYTSMLHKGQSGY